MDKAAIVFLLCLIGYCAAQDDAIVVSIEGPAEHRKHVGDTLTLVCSLNKGLTVSLTHNVVWKHVSEADPDNPVTVDLTNMGTLQDAANPDLFQVMSNFTMEIFNITLILKNVQNQMDGTFICEVQPKSAGADETLSRDVQLVVLSPVTSVSMTFDTEAPVTSIDSLEVEREEGSYAVSCEASGFNPTASLHLFLGSEELTTGGTVIMRDTEASIQANSRRYKASTSVAAVEVKAAHSGERIRCEAKGTPDSQPLEASVPLIIIALEPTITCDKNVSAEPGELYVKISCLVEHSRVEIDRYSWEIGDTGDIINGGETSKEFNEVTVEEVDPSTTKVTLDLYQTEEWHFSSLYYLDVFTTSGQQFRSKASIIRNEPTGAASTLSLSSMAVFCVGFLVTLLLSL